MKTKPAHKDANRRTIKYIIEDYLELKGLMRKGKRSLVTKTLVSGKVDVKEIGGVEGFYLGSDLILIDGRDPTCFGRLICIRPKEGKIKVRKLNCQKKI